MKASTMFRAILVFQFILSISGIVCAQPDCTNAFAFLLGSPSENERGYSLVPTPQGDGLYISGSKGDSALILKMLLDGTIEWVRTFDIVPGLDDDITVLLIDSEGMIVAAGMTGTSVGNETIFVLKYNPNTNSVLWAHSYYSTSNSFFANVIELNTGNYLFSSNPQNPNNSELVEIHRATGLIIGQATHYHLGSSETIYDMVLYAGKIYGAARFTDGGGLAQMRNTLLRIDPQTLEIEWIRLGHRPGNVSARLYTVDLIIHNNHIVSVVLGNETGTDINNTLVFVQKHTLDGDLVWIKRYNLPVSNDWVEDIIEVADGYIVMARNRVGPSDIILFKTDFDGNVVWSKSYDFRFNDSTWRLSLAQSQIVQIGDYLYFTAYSEQSGNSDLIIARVDLEGNLDDTCTVAMDINIVVSDVVNPVFYSPNITTLNYSPLEVSRDVTPVSSALEVYERCIEEFSVFEEIYEEICEGEVFEGYSETGVYTHVFVSMSGCDSTRTLHLTVHEPVLHEEFVTLCIGESYAGYTESGTYIDTLTAHSGCDSIRTLHLSIELEELEVFVEICSGNAYGPYTESGVYIDTLPGLNNGCDTLRTLELTVLPPLTETLQVSICAGESVYGYDQTGTYVDMLSTLQGCDSIRTLHLTVIDPVFYEEFVALCHGESYAGYSDPGTYIDTLTAQSGCDSIRTLHLSTEIPELDLVVEICAGSAYGPYSESGIYIDTLPGFGSACDTIRTLELILLPPLTETLTLTICEGDQIDAYTETGTYIDTLSTIQGCDSIRTLHLFIDIPHVDLIMEICAGHSYLSYTETGVYIDTLPGINNACDTVRTIDLTVLPPKMEVLNLSICEGDTIYSYSQPGSYTDTLLSAQGCDSIRTLHLTLDISVQNLLVEICAGSAYMSYTESGIYTDTIQGLNNACDTVRILELTVLLPVIEAQSLIICEGDTVYGYSEPGTYTDTLMTAHGCDSIRLLQLSVDIPVSDTFAEICHGASFLSYTETGIYLDTVPGIDGACDTIQTLYLTVLPPIQSELMHSICEGETIDGYTEAGMYVDTFTTMSGCDSIRVLHLEVGIYETYEEMIICAGSSIESYTTSGIYLDTLPGVSGACDTLRTLALTVLPPVIATIDHTMCLGETYMGYLSAGTYTDTLITAMGCDSIRVLHLAVELQEVFALAEICAGESLYGYTTQGIYTDTVPGLQGACDTVRTLHLLVNDAAETFYAVGMCEGESVYGHSTQGIHIDTLTAANGCDSIRTLDLTVSSATPPVPLAMSVCDNPFGLTQPGEYIDTLVSESGCDSIVVVSVSGVARFIPNVFSPNGDGVNDNFEVLVPSYDVMELEHFAIFDRFGGMVYDTRQWPVRWDGRGVEGQVFNPGVFAWVFIYICNGRRVIESGDVTLLR